MGVQKVKAALCRHCRSKAGHSLPSIAGFFNGYLFSRISANRENKFREILGATPPSCSAPTRQLCARSISSGR